MQRRVILFILSIILVISCTKESILPIQTDVIELSREIIEDGGFAFRNDQFELLISKNDAVKQGYSEEAYEYLQEYARKQNEAIRIRKEKMSNFTVYKDKTNSLQVVDQINAMMINGYIKSSNARSYYLTVSIEEAIDLGYTKEAYETVVQRINDETIYECDFLLQPSQSMMPNVECSTKASGLPLFGGGFLQTTVEERKITEYFDISNIPLNILYISINVIFRTDSGSGKHNFYAQTTDTYPTGIVNGSTACQQSIAVYNGGDTIAITYECTDSLCGSCSYYRAQ